MLCRKCGIREQTGLIILLCDPCFDELEKQIETDKDAAAATLITSQAIANSEELTANIEANEEIKKEIN